MSCLDVLDENTTTKLDTLQQIETNNNVTDANRCRVRFLTEDLGRLYEQRNCFRRMNALDEGKQRAAQPLPTHERSRRR